MCFACSLYFSHELKNAQSRISAHSLRLSEVSKRIKLYEESHSQLTAIIDAMRKQQSMQIKEKLLMRTQNTGRLLEV